MEEKKLDINSIIGFILIFGILIFWFYQNQPTPEELEAQKTERAKVESQVIEEEPTVPQAVLPETKIDLQDSVAIADYKNAIGGFGFTSAKEGTTVLENEVLFLEISNKGGQIIEARMKKFVTFDSIPVYLVKDGNASFGINFSTRDNRVLDSKDLFFEPSMSKNGDNQVLSMKAKVAS
ncbi:MAG: YidC/Oxa1 family insertase periplasmic-domain containing protein, partial [Eudoraea sp.]